MNKSNSRYFNTASKMNDALVSILESKPFEYITIREICEKAGVNRSTFYLHYDNTRDLLHETTRRLLNEFLSYFPADVQTVRNQYSSCDLTELNFISDQYLHPYLSYIRDHRRVFQTVLTHSETFEFDAVYRHMFTSIFDPILDRFRYPASQRSYVMHFYLNGITAIVAQWLKNDCSESISDIAQIISTCIFGKLEYRKNESHT